MTKKTPREILNKLIIDNAKELTEELKSENIKWEDVTKITDKNVDSALSSLASTQCTELEKLKKECHRDHSEMMSYICQQCKYNDIFNQALFYFQSAIKRLFEVGE